MPNQTFKRGNKRSKRQTRGNRKRLMAVKQLLFIWLGDTYKCTLTETNLQSWRRGFSKAEIKILVLKGKVEEFKRIFPFVNAYPNVTVLSHDQLLEPIMDVPAIKLLSSVIDKYGKFIMDGERSLVNESYYHLIDKFTSYKNDVQLNDEEIPSFLGRDYDAYSSLIYGERNKQFQRVSGLYKNTTVKIAARLKDLISFVYCIYTPRTLFLDIDTSLEKINRDKLNPNFSRKLLLPVIDTGEDNYKVDLYAIYSPRKINIPGSIVNNFIKLTMDYLYMLPFYYLTFTCDLTMEKMLPGKNNIGVKYLNDMFNQTSTMILAYVYYFFKDNGRGELMKKSLTILKEDGLDLDNLSNIIVETQQNMMLYPNIMLLEPRSNSLYIFGKHPHYYHGSTSNKEMKEMCIDIEIAIKEGRHILEYYDDTYNEYFTNPPTHEDYYLLSIDIFQYIHGVNMAFAGKLISAVVGITTGTFTTRKKEKLKTLKKYMIKYYNINPNLESYHKYSRLLKTWICQLLDPSFKNGFSTLFTIGKSFRLSNKNKLDFPFLGFCKVFYDGVERKGTLTRCDDGAIDFYKVFSKRYIN